MKKTLLLIVLMLTSLVAMAQTPTPTPNQPTAEELKQAKENLKVLLSDTPQQATQEKNKSTADVLDKGLDMFSGYVTTLEGVVSKYAPEVWRIMIMQQYAEAVANPLYWLFLLLVIYIYKRAIRNYFGIEKDEKLFTRRDDETKSGYGDGDAKYWTRVHFSGTIPTAASILVGIIFSYSLTSSIMVFINPEYYALKDIIQMLR